jgi:hypothetical protein
MSTYTNLPAPSPEQGMNRYLQEIRSSRFWSLKRNTCWPSGGSIMRTPKPRTGW